MTTKTQAERISELEAELEDMRGLVLKGTGMILVVCKSILDESRDASEVVRVRDWARRTIAKLVPIPEGHEADATAVFIPHPPPDSN